MCLKKSSYLKFFCGNPIYMSPRDYKYHFTQFIYNWGGGTVFQKNLCPRTENFQWRGRLFLHGMMVQLPATGYKTWWWWVKDKWVKNIAWNVLRLGPESELLMNFSPPSFFLFSCVAEYLISLTTTWESYALVMKLKFKKFAEINVEKTFK